LTEDIIAPDGKFRTGYPLSVDVDTVPAVVVKLFPDTDLSDHFVTVVVPVILPASAPSNHNAHPGILRGSNPEMLLDTPCIITLV
jgi:hypothetical protein